MIGKRGDIACRGADARLDQLVLLAVADDMGEEGEQASERMSALPRARGELALPPDRFQQYVEAPLPRGGAALHLEDRMRQ